MLFMSVNDPMFRWVLLAGLLTFALCIVLEIRMRRQRKHKRQQPVERNRHQDPTKRM